MDEGEASLSILGMDEGEASLSILNTAEQPARNGTGVRASPVINHQDGVCFLSINQ